MPDDGVTIRECIAAQKACRAELFDHMNNNQREVMGELKAINKRLDVREGKELAEGTGVNAPIAQRLKLPSITTMLKCGLLVGALAVGGFVGGCEGARMILREKAATLGPPEPTK